MGGPMTRTHLQAGKCSRSNISNGLRTLMRGGGVLVFITGKSWKYLFDLHLSEFGVANCVVLAEPARSGDSFFSMICRLHTSTKTQNGEATLSGQHIS
jgi:hypothetical protein